MASQFQPYLRAGERIVWTGRPAAGVRLSGRDVYLIPFSLLWGGFAVFWEASVLGIGFRLPAEQASVPLSMALFGAVFVAVGLFMIFGRFLVDAWIRGRTIYALTDSRALLLRRLGGEKLITASLGNPSLSRRSSDRGDIKFGGREDFASVFMNPGRSWSMWIPSLSDRVEFISIGQVTAVYKLATRTPAP
jgi:hypothetical protein